MRKEDEIDFNSLFQSKDFLDVKVYNEFTSFFDGFEKDNLVRVEIDNVAI